MTRYRTLCLLLALGLTLWLAAPAMSQDAPAPAADQAAPAAPATQPDETEQLAPPSVTVVRPSAAPTVAGEQPPAADTPKATDKPAEGVAPKPESPTDIMEGLFEGESGPPAAPASTNVGTSRESIQSDMLPAGQKNLPLQPSPPGTVSPDMDMQPVAPGAAQKLKPEGYIEIDRLGVLKRDRGRWLFVFEADSSAMTDPPMILVPNSLLEAMQKQSEDGRRPIRFRVTGEVTQYRGTNYLILRKVLIEHSMDRF